MRTSSELSPQDCPSLRVIPRVEIGLKRLREITWNCRRNTSQSLASDKKEMPIFCNFTCSLQQRFKFNPCHIAPRWPRLLAASGCHKRARSNEADHLLRPVE